MIENLDIYNFKDNDQEDDSEIISDLKNSEQKKINSKYFYDEKGSKLFDMISELKEYYPTRTEIEIIESQKYSFKNSLPSNASIIEFGSGSNKKIKKLLNALNNPKEYIPIDISYNFLIVNAKEIAKQFPSLNVKAICADLHQLESINKVIKDNSKKIGFFPGSTIGNFSEIDARKLLMGFKKILGKNSFLIIGVDLRKDKLIMERAYNDSKGITAKFNKNILIGINKKIGSKFNINNFDHKAYFNEKKKRIEMHLISRQNQNISLKNYDLKILKGESIHTENSHKYSAEEFERLVISSGYKKIDFLTDQKNYFGIFFLKVLDN
ncbi:MAG: L-histidine N(alpha)-methyltransferase [Rickettsiales bacterium]|nr:L-histidine N(alpha)-methyltransferase [Rickettsiales bacterium]